MDVSIIETNTNINVGPGQPYTTLEAALYSVANSWISPAAVVTITLLNGQHNISAINIGEHPCAARIVIQGPATWTFSPTIFVGVTGSAPTYYVTFKSASPQNVEVGDYLAMKTNSSSSLLKNHCLGVWPVTQVQDNSTKFTIKVTCKNGTPVGIIGGEITVFKTKLICSGWAGLVARFSSSFSKLKNLAIASVGSGTVGLYVTNGAAVEIDNVGFHGFLGTGVYACSGGKVLSDGRPFFVSGCANLNSARGVVCEDTGFIDCGGTTLTIGNTIISGNDYGILCNEGSINSSFSAVLDNSVGLLNQSGTFLGCGLVYEGNANVGMWTRWGGKTILSGPDWSRVKYSSTGIYSERYGYCNAYYATVQDNTVNYSPTPNQQGNYFGYIDTVVG